MAAGGLWLALALLVLILRQRRRLALLRQRSRQELETVLQQHAQELRTAQGAIVQAARQADTGLSRSLQHLPQGVVVVDKELNLVAWNSRYVELFRFPAELVRVGAPIEALLRATRAAASLSRRRPTTPCSGACATCARARPTCTKAPRATARCWRFAATRCPRAALSPAMPTSPAG